MPQVGHSPKTENFVVRAAVARTLSHKERLGDPRVRAAIEKEFKKLTGLGTWDTAEVAEWSDIKRQALAKGEQVILARGFTIVTEKHSEAANPEDRVIKARFVEDGSRLQCGDGSTPVFDTSSDSPVTTTGVRLAVAVGAQPGNKSVVLDATNAFPQVDLTGPATYLLLPDDERPEGWDKYRTPVVRIRKALYGDPRSGHDWTNNVTRKMRAKGYEPVESWPSLYTKNKVLVAVYVDDFTVSGPCQAVDEAVLELCSIFEMGTSEPLSRLLGCTYQCRPVNVDGPDGTKVCQEVTFNMTEFNSQCVQRYMELMDVEEAKLEKRKKLTPALVAHFKEMRKLSCVATPFLDDELERADPEAHDGYLSGSAAAVLMKILWTARVARPELGRVVSMLASDISRWTLHHDFALRRLVSYLDCHREDVLVGVMGDDLSECKLVGYSDADFAACKRTRRSVSGAYVELVGPYSRFPISWSSRKQGSVSQSTPESELIAANTLVRRELFPIQEALLQITGRLPTTELQEDNSTAILAMKTGASKELRHLGRVHGVSVRALHEAITEKGIKLVQCPTALMKADVLTKAFKAAGTWLELLFLIGIITRPTGEKKKPK